MREKWALWGTLVFAIAAASPHPAVADAWAEAELHIQRLPPSVVVEMPATIVQQLNARGCRIPQWSAKKPNNVIRGHFAAPRQVDWTVLCSRNHQSSIMVFWGGRAKCEPSGFGLAADKLFLTGSPRDHRDYQNIHYSRAISPANVDYIRDHLRRCIGACPKPPRPLDHQGIEDAFVGKASGIHYCHNGTWLLLPGAD